MTNCITVLHHADADGFGAAYAIHKAIGDMVFEYIPVQYGEQLPIIPEGTEILYIVDFSYPRDICEELATKYTLQIIDHHKTAEAELKGLPYAVFDMTKSGCILTWDFMYVPGTAPDILRYVEDRDLWKFELANSEEVNMYISSLPWDFKVWDDFDLNTAFLAGKAIKAFRDEQIKGVLKSVRMISLQLDEQCFEVPCVNTSDNISEIGNMLCKNYPYAPFSVSYCDRAAVRSWSLRSIGDFDVSSVAKAFGGGGHKNAAGFTTELGWPQTHSEEFIKAFGETSA
jgi:oligoribonuclease NrnB/cAMP/cGMP phosphodiesterase (DHH superfamily)